MCRSAVGSATFEARMLCLRKGSRTTWWSSGSLRSLTGTSRGQTAMRSSKRIYVEELVQFVDSFISQQPPATTRKDNHLHPHQKIHIPGIHFSNPQQHVDHRQVRTRLLWKGSQLTKGSGSNLKDTAGYSSGSDDGQAPGGRKSLAAYNKPTGQVPNPPSSDSLSAPAGKSCPSQDPPSEADP